MRLRGCALAAAICATVVVTQTPASSKDRCGRAALRACFGDNAIVAGAGKIRRKGRDGWKSTYEGGKAKDAELSRPHFAMADSDGNIYVADKDADAVRKIATDATITTVAGKPDLSSPNGLWVAANGTVYILDLGHGAVKRLATDGKLTTLFKVRGGISIGRGLWVSDDESVAYVASNTKVLRWKRKGGVKTFARGFRSLANLVVDPDGALVVTDRSAGRVYRVNAKGKKTAIAGNAKSTGGGDGKPALDTALPGVRAVWFDPSGGYFLGTHESSAVWFVDTSGTIHKFLTSKDVSEVRGLSQDSKGNLIVVDDDHGFVRVLKRK